ncbi:MAG TPA: hypothetical protein VGN37_17320 [Actinocatenispora sp.]
MDEVEPAIEAAFGTGGDDRVCCLDLTVVVFDGIRLGSMDAGRT